MGNRQTEIFLTKMKFLSVWDAFAYPCCTKSSKLEQIMIVQTHTDDGINGEFLGFFPKKQ